MTTGDESKQCTITNNSGKDVVITLAVLEQETNTSNSVLAANGGLELLKTSTGNKIADKSTATVTLDRNSKSGSGTGDPIKDYDLIVSDISWIYPLVNISVTQQSLGNTNVFNTVTVSDVKQNAMSQAIDFYQTILSYPTSQLVKDYVTAVETAKTAAQAKADGSAGSAKAVSDAIDSTMGAFFKGTKSYQKVTIADVFAADRYFKTLPSVWAQYSDNKTYYLYTSDGTTAGFAGAVSLKKTGAIDISKPNGGYTCTFAPATTPADTSSVAVDDTKKVNLTYATGIFLDDIKSDKPKVALKGCFEVKKNFTYNSTDTDAITILIGKVNGQLCIGFDTPQISRPKVKSANLQMVGDSDAASFWDSLIHPKTQLEVLRATAVFIGSIAALILSAGLVYSIYKAVKAISDHLSKDDLDKDISDTESFSDEESGIFFRHCSDDPDRDGQKVDFDAIMKENAICNAKMDAAELLKGFQKQRDALENMLEFFKEIKTQDYADLLSAREEIKNADKAITTADDSQIVDVLTKELANFSNRQNKLTSTFKNVEKIIGEEAAQAVQESLRLGGKTAQSIEDAQGDQDRDYKDDDPTLPDKIIPEMQ